MVQRATALLLALIAAALTVIAYDLHQIARMGRAWTVGANIADYAPALDPALHEDRVQREIRFQRVLAERSAVSKEARARLASSTH